MGRKKRPQPDNKPQSTPTRDPDDIAEVCSPPAKREKLSWDPDVVPDGCLPLTPAERRLVDIHTDPGHCLRKGCELPTTSRNRSYCAYHGKFFVPGKDKKGRPEPGSKCLNYTFMRNYNFVKRL
jgi:hypothetical protein